MELPRIYYVYTSLFNRFVLMLFGVVVLYAMPTGSCAFAVLAALASVSGNELDSKIDRVGVFFVFGVQRKLCQSGKPALCKGLPVETLEVPFKTCV